jgi:hypothetical protein
LWFAEYLGGYIVGGFEGWGKVESDSGLFDDAVWKGSHIIDAISYTAA